MDARNYFSSLFFPCRRVSGKLSRMTPWIFLVVAVSFSSFAQGLGEPDGKEQRITTLIATKVTQNKPECGSDLTVSLDCSASLQFERIPLPPDAKVTAARLILVARTGGPDNESDTIKATRVTDDGQPTPNPPFGAVTLGPKEPALDTRTVWTANRRFVEKFPQEPIRLALTANKNARRMWYSHLSGSSERPRLVVEYELPRSRATPRSDGLPAIHSPRAFLPQRNGSAGDGFSYVVRSFPKAWSYTPAFFRDWVYILTDDVGKKSLLALDMLGNPLQKMELPSSVGQHLLISKDGNLVVVGNGRISVYPLGVALAPAMPPSSPLYDIDVKDLNPAAAVSPTLGADGGLYYVNGLDAQGHNPALQELWRVPLQTKTTSRITVGPSRRFVYLTTMQEGLVTINAQTGEFSSHELPNQSALRTASAVSLHAPVVMRLPDGTERVFVAADSVDSGEIACFDNGNTANQKRDAEENGRTVLRKCEGPPAGLWGRPILDRRPKANPLGTEIGNPNELYAVRVDRVGEYKVTLENIHWTHGTQTPVLEYAVSSSPYLLNGGNLAIDALGNCFLWNGEGKTAREIGLYVSCASPSRLLQLPDSVPAPIQLFFGNSGTLYINNVKDHIVSAVVPQYTLNAEKGGVISSPTHLRVEGKVGNDTKLEAGGNVILGPEFAVAQGATLSVVTNLHSP